MDLEITGRGTPITQKLREQATEGLARIERILGPKCVAKVVLSCEKNRCEAEVTVRNTLTAFASHTSAKEAAIALKEALDKVEAQAVKARKRVVTTRHHPEQTAAGSIRLQAADADLNGKIKDTTGADSRRPAQSKTAVGKAIARIDDGMSYSQGISAA